jgi:hypothetical protein
MNLHDIINDVEKVVQKTKQDFDKEKIKLGVAGLPGIQERFGLLIEKAEREGLIKLNAAMQTTLLSGYLAGVAMMINMLRETESFEDSQIAVKCLQGVESELAILLLEQEVTVYKQIARELDNEE